MDFLKIQMYVLKETFLHHQKETYLKHKCTLKFKGKERKSLCQENT